MIISPIISQTLGSKELPLSTIYSILNIRRLKKVLPVNSCTLILFTPSLMTIFFSTKHQLQAWKDICTKDSDLRLARNKFKSPLYSQALFNC